MILPVILSLLLMICPQGQASNWCTVTPADDNVAAAAVDAVRAEVEPALARLRPLFPGLPRSAFRIVVHASAATLPPELQSFHHESSPGFALLGRHEIHVLFAEARNNVNGLEPIVAHELVHEILHQACEPWGARIPRWFHEGLAQVIAEDTYLGASEDAIVWRAAAQQLLPFFELGEGFPTDPIKLRVAYAQSYSFVAWLRQQIGLPALIAMARSVDGERSFEQALVLATDLPTATLFDGWREFLVNGSGAKWRVLLQQFFGLSMVLALPLLAMAMIRRQRVDQAARAKLQREDSMQVQSPPLAIAAAMDTAPSADASDEGLDDGDDADSDDSDDSDDADYDSHCENDNDGDNDGDSDEDAEDDDERAAAGIAAAAIDLHDEDDDGFADPSADRGDDSTADAAPDVGNDAPRPRADGAGSAPRHPAGGDADA